MQSMGFGDSTLVQHHPGSAIPKFHPSPICLVVERCSVWWFGAGLEISKAGLSNTYKKFISRANFALLMLTLSISKAPSFLLYLYLRYLHINYPITYVYLRFLTTLLRFFDYFT